jgi:hypothetical protein
MSASCPLIGNWRLVSFTQVGDDGKPYEFFGESPKGFITYLDSGFMSVLFASSHRTPFSGAWEAVADKQKAENYDAMVAYSGRYTFHGDRVVHHVETCWIPNWEGRDLERFLTFFPDGRVRLRTPEKRFGRPQPIQDVIVEPASSSIA